MAKGLFLVGTARGVGKTLIGAGLVGVLRRRGIDATLMTPVTTGGSVESASELLQAIGVEDPPRLTAPLVYETMAAPIVASQIEERPVDIERILSAYHELSRGHRFVVVEGGGVLVPLARRYMMIDLLEEMDLPSLIVGRTGRGTLNHCLLTQRGLLSRGIHPVGFVLNGFGQYGDGFAESLNPDVLSELAAPTPVLATVEWRPAHQTDINKVVSSLEQQGPLLEALMSLTQAPDISSGL